MQETGDPTKRKAKWISWWTMERGLRGQSVQTGGIITMPSAVRPHCLPENMLYQSKGVNQGRESHEIQDTHRPPIQKKGKGNFKDDSKVKSQDGNWMAERTASPDWRKMKVSRRDTSREKTTGNSRLPPRIDLMGKSAVGRICNGCKESWADENNKTIINFRKNKSKKK